MKRAGGAPRDFDQDTMPVFPKPINSLFRQYRKTIFSSIGKCFKMTELICSKRTHTTHTKQQQKQRKWEKMSMASAHSPFQGRGTHKMFYG